MITVDVKQLLSAIEEADAFSLPEMNGGTRYIYDELYGRLSKGTALRLSEIDFDRFELDDIDSMRDFYSNTLEANEYKSDALARTLLNIPPAALSSMFI